MKITRILAYRVELPLVETTYKWSGGKSVTVFDSTIVRVETDASITGHGEVCPLGPFYLPAYAEAVRAGLRELGPHLLGEDPRQLAKLNRTMDAALKGHPYVKSGVGIAMTLEDSWGGDIATAAIAHLAHSTPEEFRFTSTDFNSYVTVSTADGAPQRKQGRMAAGKAPGLGIAPKMDVLGTPVVVIE